MKRAARMLRRALKLEDRVRLATQSLANLLDDPRLADARLAAD
jgi:hypothetical protein